jgi:GTP-binding protein
MSDLTATFITSSAYPEQIPHGSFPQVALLGRSNVRKSSLINSIARQKGLSRTSSTPGRTRLINLFRFGRAFDLIDLPGYGYAKAPAGEKREFQQRVFDVLDHAERLKLAVVIVDARIGPTPLDIQMLMLLEEKGMPFFVIANKIDKLSGNERIKSLKLIREAIPGATIFVHSAETTEGRNEILAAIQAACKS